MNALFMAGKQSPNIYEIELIQKFIIRKNDLLRPWALLYTFIQAAYIASILTTQSVQVHIGWLVVNLSL
jgi:hypothetical protein